MAGNAVFDKWLNDDGSENFKCRAWVNFNGAGTVAINASGNVSSVTDNGIGYYIVNMTTPVELHRAVATTQGSHAESTIRTLTPTTTTVVLLTYSAGVLADTNDISVAVVR